MYMYSELGALGKASQEQYRESWKNNVKLLKSTASQIALYLEALAPQIDKVVIAPMVNNPVMYQRWTRVKYDTPRIIGHVEKGSIIDIKNNFRHNYGDLLKALKREIADLEQLEIALNKED